MSRKIGLISDVHAAAEPVAEALNLFQQHGVDEIYCLGDIAGYGVELDATVDLLIQAECLSIRGNHDDWFLEDHRDEARPQTVAYLDNMPVTLEYEIEGKRIYMVHASPPQSTMEGIKLLDLDGNCIEELAGKWTQNLENFNNDVLIVGHTHQVYAEQLGQVLVINPGSTRFNHACMILSLPDLQVEILPLSGRSIRKAWNWGMMSH